MTPEEKEELNRRYPGWTWQWWVVGAIFIWWFNGGRMQVRSFINGATPQMCQQGGMDDYYSPYIQAGYQWHSDGRLHAPLPPVDSYGWAVDGSGWVGQPGRQEGLASGRYGPVIR